MVKNSLMNFYKLNKYINMSAVKQTFTLMEIINMLISVGQVVKTWKFGISELRTRGYRLVLVEENVT